MLIARCPACQTTFRARPEHLGARGGRVRCGHCYTPFNALENLVEQAPDPSPGEQVPSARLADLSTTQTVAENPQTDPGQNADSPQASAHPVDMANSTGVDVDERLARALSAWDGIRPPSAMALGRPGFAGYEVDPHEALTEPPGVSEADAFHTEEPEPGHLAFKPASGQQDAFSALRWAPVHNRGATSAKQPNAVWPTLVAQPAEPETLQPGVFPDSSSYDTPPPEAGGEEPSWPAMPPDQTAGTPEAPRKSVDGRPRGAVADERREPTLHANEVPPAVPVGADDAPDFSRYGKAEHRGKVWLWALMVGVLLGSLAVQSVYVFRVELARQWPQLRPVFVGLCDRLGCDMPLPRDPQAINVTASNLESDPSAPSHYVLHARLRNEASFLQAHPHLELTLTDARDRPVARRVLAPAEWLPNETIDAGFEGRAELEIRLPFSAPELTGATGYRIYAFYP